MHTGESLEPVRVAAAIAPIIDRLRMAVVRAIRPMETELAERLGLPEGVLGPLGMLRNTMPDRVVSLDDLLEVFVYQPSDTVLSAVGRLTTANLLESVGDGEIRLTKASHPLVHEVMGRMQSFLDELWSDRGPLVDALLPLAQRACAAVGDTGGRATQVMAPPYDPPNASPALLLAEALTPLRFHRHDAHAQAWRSEGLTAEQIQQLAPGPQRQLIEDETNRLAATPYAVLTADERFTLVTGLGALPN
ncbi:MAG: hypothetical protein ACTHK4_11495 [Mycobacteriales bacterium]